MTTKEDVALTLALSECQRLTEQVQSMALENRELRKKVRRLGNAVSLFLFSISVAISILGIWWVIR